MRPSSRLLSVFLALILIGLSVATVGAHESLGDSATNDERTAHEEDIDHTVAVPDGDNTTPTYGASIRVFRSDFADVVYPDDKVKFQVLIRSGNHGIPATEN